MKKVVLAIIASCIASSAFADSNSSFQISKLGYNDPLYGVSGYGFSMIGKAGDNWFVTVGVANLATDNKHYVSDGWDWVYERIDSDSLSFGVGYDNKVSDKFYTETIVEYAEAEASTSLGSTSVDGYAITQGFHFLADEQLELSAEYNYAKLDGYSEEGYTIGAEFRFDQDVAFRFDYSEIEDFDSTSLGIRFYF